MPASLTSLPIFIVTVENPGGARRRSAADQLQSVGLGFEFVEGALASEGEIDEAFDAKENRRRMKRRMSRGEIAAYLSHRRAMNRFLDTRAEACLILEDDFSIVHPAQFRDELAALLQVPVHWDLIKLFDVRPRPIRDRVPLGRIELVEYLHPTAGMVGYLITREAAEKFLGRPKPFRQIDEDTKYYWELDLMIFSAVPNLLQEISPQLGGSLINAEREAVRSRRTIRRELYGNWLKLRWQISELRNRNRYSLAEARRRYAENAGSRRPRFP